MNRSNRLQERVTANYADLSVKLRAAADYVLANEMDVAVRSLRAISASSGVSPATLSRLARVLGFVSYEELRELCRETVGERSQSLIQRAQKLQDGSEEAPIYDRQATACIANITTLVQTMDNDRLQKAVNALSDAESVVLFGAFGSTGIVEYMAYLANYFSTNWTLAGRMGASLGASLAAMGQKDVLIVVTKTPYASRAVRAIEAAKQIGAKTIVISDSHACPAIKFATFPFIVPSDSPQFFSSYAATLTLMESMVAMLVAQSGEGTNERIREVERHNQRLGDFWVD
ncbi:MAG: MurR/RpiR family transcriptional regulator [Shimia sp.]|uniref:MurR/RpiR family transcriptional regulator n=1 Tax=Shimia sp. TaxID=1954381 RepID=UPI001B2B2706|nr:MurR/RpiR family transcriptional regulator [Shimia sp.]MBO6896452.1 MurR/RpiR family transcriptional regulator [Shimia sp.]